jgi:co-chaperonin GroES (HSP10)
MEIKMKNGNILGVLQDQTKTDQGLYIPDNKSYNKIEVVKPVEGVNKGDILYVLKRCGTEVTIDGKDYIVVNEREIILIV